VIRKAMRGDTADAQARLDGCGAEAELIGLAKDQPLPDDATKVKLRRQALDWLKAELAAWTKFLETAKPQARPGVAEKLQLHH
jgi:hypothetical protein